MKKQILTLFVLCAFSITGALAQRGHHDHPERNHKEHFTKMQQELNLSNDQAQQIKQIMKENRDRMDMAHADGQVSEEERAQHREMRQETDKKIMAVLNADQQKKYQAMKKERRKEMRARRAQE